MSVCFFNMDYDHRYRCEYSIESELFKINVEYNIAKEVESINGVKYVSANTEYKDRDILVVDAAHNISYLLKNAFYAGASSRLGMLDGIITTSFVATEYFESTDPNHLMRLKPVPRVSKIKLYSKAITDYTLHPSVKRENTKEEIIIHLTKKNHTDIEIKHNNIARISVGDNWYYNPQKYAIEIEMNGYISIQLVRRVKYTELDEYIYEIMIFMQLYYPGKFKVDKIVVEVDDYEYIYNLQVRKPKYTERHTLFSVRMRLPEFLRECYIKIPYRKSKNEIRNIPYIIMHKYSSIEDHILMLYRFIECYYKRHNINDFMINCFHDHDKHGLSEEEQRKYTQEIICLRNHYVHAGYYIKNSSLKITFGKEKEDLRNYTAKADNKWIYDRMKLLYDMVIDIIFTEMLGIESYNYQRDV